MSQDVDFRPSGPMRPNAIYTSWRLHKALGLVARKTGKTREDLAEAILSSYVREFHVEIESWMQQREDDEKAFMAKLKSVQPKEPQ